MAEPILLATSEAQDMVWPFVTFREVSSIIDSYMRYLFYKMQPEGQGHKYKFLGGPLCSLITPEDDQW